LNKDTKRNFSSTYFLCIPSSVAYTGQPQNLNGDCSKCS